MTTKINPKVVNTLVRKSFGWGVSADWEELYDEHEKYKTYQRNYRLGIIARPNTFVNIPNSSLTRLKIRGIFTRPDGSELEVAKDYVQQAEQYARLYEDCTGKKVKIKIRKKILTKPEEIEEIMRERSY